MKKAVEGGEPRLLAAGSCESQWTNVVRHLSVLDGTR